MNLKEKNESYKRLWVLPFTNGSSAGAWWGSCWIVSVVEKAEILGRGAAYITL